MFQNLIKINQSFFGQKNRTSYESSGLKIYGMKQMTISIRVVDIMVTCDPVNFFQEVHSHNCLNLMLLIEELRRT